jgi:peptidoglycan/LPS O-acetylase OafA/YrhL
MYTECEDLPVPARPSGGHSAEVHAIPHAGKYRPDIDGLRAVAVISVLLNHLSPALIPGGYTGVDIFFVISGFVITTKIYPEAAERRFSIREFYKRRINRIVPALVAVLAVTGACGAFLLSPADLVRLAFCTIAAILSVSNIYLWREYGNYFSANAEEAPLLHTWSLGVEEQFYIVWPLAILALARLKPGHAAAALALLTVIGVAASEYAVGHVASASYYLLPTRFFELMIGGLLAFPVYGAAASLKGLQGVCRIAGYALIAWSLFALNGSSPFPGVNALLPCAGAALIVFAGMRPTPRPLLLTARPVVFTGLISYSLYLWHWPIIAYLNYLNVEIGAVTAAGVIAASYLLAYASWKFVETPLRRNGNAVAFSSVLTRRFVLPAGAAVALSVGVVYARGIPQRFPPSVAELEQAAQTQPEMLRGPCHVPTALYKTPPNPACKLGADKAEFDGLLIGDSFANHFTGMLDVLGKASGLAIQDYTMNGCPPILGYDTGKGPFYAASCKARNQAAYAYIQGGRFPLVILAADWPEEEIAGTRLKSSVERILASGAKLAIVLSNAKMAHAENCPVRNAMYGLARDCSGARADPPAYIGAISRAYPQIQIIDPNEAACSAGRCSPVYRGAVLYRDASHLNDVGSRLIGEVLVASGVRLQP